jgi:hypothetical protein
MHGQDNREEDFEREFLREVLGPDNREEDLDIAFLREIGAEGESKTRRQTAREVAPAGNKPWAWEEEQLLLAAAQRAAHGKPWCQALATALGRTGPAVKCHHQILLERERDHQILLERERARNRKPPSANAVKQSWIRTKAPGKQYQKDKAKMRHVGAFR